MTIDAIDVRLEQALAVLSSGASSAASLKFAGKEARGVVVAIDEESERGPQREAQILATLMQGIPPGRSIGETTAALGGSTMRSRAARSRAKLRRISRRPSTRGQPK